MLMLNTWEWLSLLYRVDAGPGQGWVQLHKITSITITFKYKFQLQFHLHNVILNYNYNYTMFISITNQFSLS